MYRAARSLVASSLADENTSVVLWPEHYTGTNLFAFVTFASALETATGYEARGRLKLLWWNACRALREKSSIPFRTSDSLGCTRHSRLVPVSFFTDFILAARVGHGIFITTDHNFTDCRHALRARDHALAAATFCVPQSGISCAVAAFFFYRSNRDWRRNFAAAGQASQELSAVFYAKSAH